MKWNLSSLEFNMKKAGLNFYSDEDRAVYKEICKDITKKEDCPPELVELPRLIDFDYENMKVYKLDPENTQDCEKYRWMLAERINNKYIPLAMPEKR